LENSTGGIEGFKIGNQGAVTAISGLPTLTTITGVLATEPSGQALYAQGSDGVHVFAIDQTSGVLTEISGSPFSDGNDARQMVVDRTGTVLIVSSSTGSTDTGTPTTVSTFHIAP
jgi:6-phosphogluconolactonase (cycloisomerase 2 family)